MIKYFCDRCGKDVSDEMKNSVEIGRPFILCEECMANAVEFITKPWKMQCLAEEVKTK